LHFVHGIVLYRVLVRIKNKKTIISERVSADTVAGRRIEIDAITVVCYVVSVNTVAGSARELDPIAVVCYVVSAYAVAGR